MIVGDFAADMVEDVGLGDTVGSMRSDPGHDTAEITKKLTVEGSKSTTGEGKLGSTVVRKEWVGVLQEGDQHEPVVNPVCC